MNIARLIVSTLLLFVFSSCSEPVNKVEDKKSNVKDTVLKTNKMSTGGDDSFYDAYYNIDSLKQLKIDTRTLEGKRMQWEVNQVIQHKATFPNGYEPEIDITTADINGDGILELLAESNCFGFGTGNYNWCQKVYFMNRDKQLFEDTPRIDLANPVWYRRQKKVYSYYRAVSYITGEAYEIRMDKLRIFEKILIEENDSGDYILERKDGDNKLLSKKVFSNFDHFSDLIPAKYYEPSKRKPFGLH